MINQKFGIKSFIFTIVLCIICVALMLWRFIVEGIITADNWFAIVSFYSCFIILIFAMTEIEYCAIDNHISIKALKYKIFLLLEKNKDSLTQFQDFYTTKRKKEIVKQLALIRYFCDEKYDEDFCLQKYEQNDVNYFYKLLKNKRLEDKAYYKSEVKEYFETKDLPMYFYLFQSYYASELLKTKSSIGGILATTFSAILGIVSLVSLDALSVLSLGFWCVLAIGFLLEVFYTAICWKIKLRDYANSLTIAYDNLKEDIDEFLENKK